MEFINKCDLVLVSDSIVYLNIDKWCRICSLIHIAASTILIKAIVIEVISRTESLSHKNLLEQWILL